MSARYNESWGFNRLPDMERTKSLTLQATYPDPQVIVRPAIADPVVSYPPRHLLGLPYEIRLVIINFMSNSVLWSAGQPFHKKPRDDYRGFSMACRQTYFEWKHSWYRYIVSWPKVQQLLETKFNRTMIRKYESLSIEIDVNAHPNYFTGLAAVLFKAQPYLRHLRLYFFDNDTHNDKVQNYSCRKFQKQVRGLALDTTDQRLMAFLPLWKRIAALGRLEVLVISSPIIHIFEPMVLMKKPYLEYLSLSANPGSIRSLKHSMNDLGFLLTSIPPHDHYPPVKVLEITSNATLSSNALAAKLGETLEHLTWVVPDPASDQSAVDHGSNTRTAELFHALRRKATRLHTLRICLQGAPILESPEHGTLLGSIKTHLPHMKTLKNLEIHVNSESQWFGKEVVARLPNSLENIYLSDNFLKPRDLLHQIWERYLAATRIDTIDRGTPDVTLIRHGPKSIQKHLQKDSTPERLVLDQDCGPWLMSLNPYCHYSVNSSEEGAGAMLHRNRSAPDCIDQPGYFDDPRYIREYRQSKMQLDLIGERQMRHDHIPFHTGQLRFVHYEFSEQNTDELVEEFPPTILTILLINGRLLDKARNNHLRKYDGAHIPPNDQQQYKTTHSNESATHSAHIGYAMLLHQLYEVESTCPRDIATYQSDLQQSSQLRQEIDYFGHEPQAMAVFENEYIARPEELQEYCYPVEKPVADHRKCHWMSPEPVIEEEDS